MAAYVDGNSYSNNTSGTSCPAGAINLVAGNAVVVGVRYENGVTTASVADTAGNTYTEIPASHIQQGGTSGYVTAFYCLDCLGDASNVITVTLGAARTWRRVAVEQFSGLDSFVNHETASGTGTSVSGSGLSASGAGLLVGWTGTFNGVTYTLGGDLANNRIFTGSDVAHDGDYIVPGSGTYTSAFTFSGSTGHALISSLFADTSAGTVVNCATDVLTLTEYPATVNAETSISANVDTLTLTEYQATVSLTTDTNVLASVQVLTLTEYTANINAETNVNTNTDVLTLNTYQATVSLVTGTNVFASVDVLTLTEHQASINAETNIQAAVQVLTLTEYQASIGLDIGITIDGAGTYIINTAYGSVTMYNNGSNYFTI